MQTIKAIYFPNTMALFEGNAFYSEKVVSSARTPLTGFTEEVDEIRYMTKNGDSGEMGWFQVVRNGVVIAHIKESVCHVFFAEEQP